MLKKKITSCLLAAALAVSSLGLAVSAAGDETPATRGQVADMVLRAADDYTEGLERSDIIKGYGDGDTMDDKSITRAESFVMISRAFGALPAPAGHMARVSLTDVQYTDIPDWAEAEVKNLVQAGVLVGDGESSLASEEPVTAEQVDTIVRRIYSLLGKNKKDDFYASVNREWLNQSVIKPGDVSTGTFMELQNQVDDRVSGIIQEIVQKTNGRSEKEEKVADFYQAAADMEARNKAGAAPLKPYLERIDAAADAGDLDGLLAADEYFGAQTGSRLLLDFAVSENAKDSTAYALYFGTYGPKLPKEAYADADKTAIYKRYLTNLLTYAGEAEDAAQKQADLVIALETDIANNKLTVQEQYDVDKTFNPYTVEELQELVANADVRALIAEAGYAVPEDFVVVTDVKAAETFCKYLNTEHTETLRAVMKAGAVQGMMGALDQKAVDIANQFSQEYYGMDGAKSSEELASQATQGTMSDYLESLYVEKYFPPEAKADVEAMLQEFIGIYEERIGQLDWMSSTTKEKARLKLETMKVKVGYPEQRDSALDNAEIRNTGDGGSYLENILSIARENRKQNIEKQGTPVDKTAWITSAITVNAFYNPSANEIIFPAAILQAPFYDISAAREENLGGIGIVIAHEITHAFDNNGAKYDENGNAADWWTAEDYAQFNALCGKVAAYYDGAEAAPGLCTNGAQTLSENIADLGGISCAVTAMERLEAPDYDRFFQNIMRCWTASYTRPYLEMLTQLDVHSPEKIRANRMAASQDVFYETYGIEEGDGMYAAPEDRAKIW